jgi:hypothetical protein
VILRRVFLDSVDAMGYFLILVLKLDAVSKLHVGGSMGAQVSA